MKQVFQVQLSKEEAKNLKQNLENAKKSGSNNVSDIYSTLQINRDNIKSFLKKHSKLVDIETCFSVFKLVNFFNIKPSSKGFFLFDKISIDELLTYLAFILRKIKSEEDNQLFDDFLESGDLIQLFSDKILDCFKSKYFADLKIQRIVKIIENRYKNPNNFIDSDALFSFISKSINERFVLLRFINFNYLTATLIKTSDVKQYVINLITQYDECLKTLISLNQDKNQQLKIFNNLSKKGNQIAAYYISSQKVSGGNSKSGGQFNNSMQNRQWSNLSKTTKGSDNIRQKTSIKKGDDRDDGTQNQDGYDDYDYYTDEDDDDDDVGNQMNAKGMTKTMKKSDIKNDDKMSKTMRKDPQPAAPAKKTKKKKKKIVKKTKTKVQANNNNDDNDDDKFIILRKNFDSSEEDSDEEEDKNEVFNARTSKTLNPNFGSRNKKPFKTGQYHRPLTVDDKERAIIWKETEEIVQKGFYKDSRTSKTYTIRKDVDESINQTEIIKPKHKPKVAIDQQKITKKAKEKIKSIVKVVNKSTFEAARNCSENDKNDVCVLNFASATQPGGGVKNGRGAQEETLSRMSSLYFSLVADRSMYDYHKKQNDPFYSDYMIFSPNVVVFRDDDYNLIPFYHVAVISAAAVNCQEVKQLYGSSQKIEDKIYETMKNRCRKILLLCLEKGYHSIVLGAFGCGVFKNKPEDVSEIFRELIIDEGIGLEFDEIVFAIKSPQNSQNYTLKQFKKAFE